MSMGAAQVDPGVGAGGSATRQAGPHIVLTFAEAQRAVIEAGSMLTLGPLMSALPKGDGHGGMAFNPAVLWVVADRLAQAANGWRPSPAPVPDVTFSLGRCLLPDRSAPPVAPSADPSALRCRCGRAP